MIIFLGIVGEVATLIGTIAINLNSAVDSVLEIAKNGYKIDKKVLDEYEKKLAEKKQQKNSTARRILGLILLLLPGVNLICASIKGVKLKKEIMNDPEIKEAIIPMTDEEKEFYAKLEGKMQKLTYTAFTSANDNEEEEFFGFVGRRPIVVDHGLTSLYYDQLEPLNYTLDEVKKLNESTSYSYRIGELDGKNVAIIGIPNPNSTVSRIEFKSDNNKIKHTYEKMTEEEAQDKTFIVYPFMSDPDEKLQKIIDEIKQSRIADATKVNFEEFKDEMQTQVEYEIVDDNVKNTAQQGPVLNKRLNTRNTNN